MLSRKKYLFKKKLQYFNSTNSSINYLIKTSLKNNFSQAPMQRLTLFVQKFYFNRHNRFYNSQNKLYCPITFTKKVPSRRFGYSRFYLVRNLDGLAIPSFQK